MENSNGGNTNVGSIENSIEKDIEIIEDFILKTDVDYSEYNEQIIGDISYQAIQHLLSAYQEVLKENEQLRTEVNSLKEENEELEEINNELEAEKNEAIRRYNFETIPIQKVKDKIEEYKNILKTCNKAQDINRIKAINERVLELQELLESEE